MIIIYSDRTTRGIYTHYQNICGGKAPAICIDFACHELKTAWCLWNISIFTADCPDLRDAPLS